MGATVFAVGDSHFTEHARFAECLRVHGWVAEQVEAERPAAFLHAGDLYDGPSTPTERAAVADWLARIAEVCPVVIAKGNHDRHRDLELLGRLRTRHPVIVEERAGVHVVGGVAVAAVAWPSRSALAQSVGRAAGTEELNAAARGALEAILSGLRAELEQHNVPSVLLGHFMIDGSTTSVGQPLVGAEMNVGVESLALTNADITICGHIHKPQQWSTESGLPVVYTGSPYRTSYGEVEQKSYLRAEFECLEPGVSWERIPTPCAGMLLLEGAFADGGLVLATEPGDEELRGAEVRLRYSVAGDARDAARRAATVWRDVLVGRGALAVKVEERVHVETRARAPEIARATSLEDKLRAMWRSRGGAGEGREGRLLARLGEIEEVAHAS